jgi:hypothetical protein
MTAVSSCYSTQCAERVLKCANPGPARGATGSGYARDQSTTLFEHEAPIAIDVSRVDAVNGALLGLLLRASRRLAWRNRQLTIVCRDPETFRRLRIAGLDELATLVESA